VKIKQKEEKCLYMILFSLTAFKTTIINRKYSIVVTSNVTDKETNFPRKLSMMMMMMMMMIIIIN
jgi:hypothetical protein